jgi:hypothetical protein
MGSAGYMADPAQKHRNDWRYYERLIGKPENIQLKRKPRGLQNQSWEYDVFFGTSDYRLVVLKYGIGYVNVIRLPRGKDAVASRNQPYRLNFMAD